MFFFQFMLETAVTDAALGFVPLFYRMRFFPLTFGRKREEGFGDG
jgi:hypothetical protein